MRDAMRGMVHMAIHRMAPYGIMQYTTWPHMAQCTTLRGMVHTREARGQGAGTHEAIEGGEGEGRGILADFKTWRRRHEGK